MSFNYDWEPINWKDYLVILAVVILVVAITWMAHRGV